MEFKPQVVFSRCVLNSKISTQNVSLLLTKASLPGITKNDWEGHVVSLNPSIRNAEVKCGGEGMFLLLTEKAEVQINKLKSILIQYGMRSLQDRRGTVQHSIELCRTEHTQIRSALL